MINQREDVGDKAPALLSIEDRKSLSKGTTDAGEALEAEFVFAMW